MLTFRASSALVCPWTDTMMYERPRTVHSVVVGGQFLKITRAYRPQEKILLTVFGLQGNGYACVTAQ